jgi:hypothetical protein
LRSGTIHTLGTLANIKTKISKIKFLSYETILHVTSYYAFPIKWK